MTMQVNGSVGITYPDGSVQTTAYLGGTSGVVTFSGGATGLTPAGAASGAVSVGGVLNPTHGGTGTIDPNGLLFFNGASPATTATPAEIIAQIGPVPVNAALNLQGGLANQIPYQTAANTTTFMAAPTASNTTLIWDGTAFTWRNQGDTYQGTWDATTNTPAIVSGVGINGEYYVVSVAGTTTIDGISDWQIGDQIIFNGSVWQQVTGSGVGAFPNLIVSSLTGYMYANGSGLVTAGPLPPVNNLAGGGANQVAYQTALDTTAFIPAPTTANQTLTYDGTNLVWGSGGFPTGTRLVFQQTAAPTGWTKDVANNDVALRVVSGAVSSGGTVSFSTAFNAANTVDGTAISVAQMPSHGHGITDPGHGHTVNDPGHSHTTNDPGHQHSYRLDVNGANVAFVGNQGNLGGPTLETGGSGTFFSISTATQSITTSVSINGSGTGVNNNPSGTGVSVDNNGSNATHNHALTNLAVQYVDVIIATKI